MRRISDRLRQREELYFRFYDPRVLRVFLPVCTHEEAAQLLGPLSCFLMENDKADTLLQFRVAETGLKTEEHKL